MYRLELDLIIDQDPKFMDDCLRIVIRLELELPCGWGGGCVKSYEKAKIRSYFLKKLALSKISRATNGSI